jgi:uncharacterized membrane protein YphA (DoxX/SURF4 family)
MMAAMIDPAVAALLAGASALLFLSAALHKFLDLGSFRQALSAYQLLPAPLTRFAPAVPLLESAVGFALLSTAARPAAACAGAVLLGLYATAIAVNLARGRRDLSCGCGGPNDRRPIASWMVWRNLTLAGLLLLLWQPAPVRPMAASDALTIGAGTAVAALLYISLDTLLGRSMAWRVSARGGR